MKALVSVLFLFGCMTARAADYRAVLSGKTLIMEGARCAGVWLGANPGLSNEWLNPTCSVDLPARLKWISGDAFVLIEKNRVNETSPPRVYLYRVKSLSGKRVVLTKIWTGWNNLSDDDQAYVIKD